MTAMYRTKVTATFEIEVEADSIDEAERIVDGVLDSKPVVLLVEGGKASDMTDVLTGVHAPNDVVDVLASDAAENVIVRGSLYRVRQ